MIDNDTICAIAAPAGGAIGLIRVSGPKAIEITSQIFVPLQGEPLTNRLPYTLTFGKILSLSEEVIDEVLVSLFRAPHSYTGEDSTEISCHGSPYILQQIMQLLILYGCRTAQPGEYTQRAFLNGKMDLSQAEAVADLIASSSAATHRLAMSQLRGGFSNELTLLRDRLLHFASLIELELDFSDHEEIEFADRTELCRLAEGIEQTLTGLVNSFSVGNALKKGVPVAIVGETNTGKSTLLNLLVSEEKAIVSDIPGTTRDLIEDAVNIEGITFRFMDTAGIRETKETIETLGIHRTFHTLEQAEIILWVIDITDAASQINRLSAQILPRCENKQLILVFNKTDLLDSPLNKAEAMENFKEFESVKSIFISAKERTRISDLQHLLVEAAHLPEVTQDDAIVTNVRHYEALSHALESIRHLLQGLTLHLTGDLLAQDIRESIFHLGQITRPITTDQILQTIFKNFCIGK